MSEDSPKNPLQRLIALAAKLLVKAARATQKATGGDPQEILDGYTEALRDAVRKELHTSQSVQEPPLTGIRDIPEGHDPTWTERLGVKQGGTGMAIGSTGERRGHEMQQQRSRKIDPGAQGQQQQ